MNIFNLKYISISSLDVTNLKDYYIWERDEFPDKSGVYIIYGRNDEPIYVGEGQSIKSRIATHLKEGENGSYKDKKGTIERNIARQQQGLEIIPDENQAWYKRYFYKVKFIECEAVERKMLEIFLMNTYDTPFNKKDNMYFREEYAEEYETKHLKNLMYSVEDDDVLNPAEEIAKVIGIPTEEFILYFFYERLSSTTKGIINKVMSYPDFKGSRLEKQLEEILKNWAGQNYAEQKSYFSKFLQNGPDHYHELDTENVFIFSPYDDEKLTELIEIINKFHR